MHRVVFLPQSRPESGEDVFRECSLKVTFTPALSNGLMFFCGVRVRAYA